MFFVVGQSPSCGGKITQALEVCCLVSTDVFCFISQLLFTRFTLFIPAVGSYEIRAGKI